jgi:hypothetical protein
MATETSNEWRIDFLEARPDTPADALALQLREARNVVSSYSHAIDFLAEALQNSADAIDARRNRAAASQETTDVAAELHIRFDCRARSFTVTDTGIGMSRQDLDLVLTPNVTLKAGRQAREGTQRSRGHKGVGLSFLALASNYLHIRTCDGKARYDVVVRGGERWVSSGGETEKPMGEAVRNEADTALGSPTYTEVTVGEFDSEDLEDDLFDLEIDELAWRLRTATAVGHTQPLFDGVDRLPPERNITVTLDFVDARGNEVLGQDVPYKYASLEELVPAARRVDFQQVIASEATGSALVEAVRGKGVRYVEDWRSASGRAIKVYAFAMDGRDVAEIEKEHADSGRFFPSEWQGTFVATRGMPTTVEVNHDLIQPRTFRRRLFMLLQDDELQLDVGRKTLTGPTTRMLRSIIKGAWEQDLSKVVPRLQPLGRTADREVLDQIIARALRKPDLAAHVPYRKRPGEPIGVLALFHELLGRGNGYLPSLGTLQTGVLRAETDSIVVPGDGEPLHVLFAASGPALLKELAREDGTAQTAQLGVVWNLQDQKLREQGIEVRETDPGIDGATHELELFELAGISLLRVIELATVVRERG